MRYFKILLLTSTLSVSFAFLVNFAHAEERILFQESEASAHLNNHADAIHFINLEGIYNLHTDYTNSKGTNAYKTLDRLIFMYAPSEQKLSLALSASESGQALFYFEDVNFKVDSAKNQLLLFSEGFRGNGIYGELKLKFNLSDATFQGTFTDGLAQGYKELSGEGIHTVGSLRTNSWTKNDDVDSITGVYQDDLSRDTRNFDLLVRKYSSGNYSAKLSSRTHTWRILFPVGLYSPSLGLLSLVKRNSNSGIYQKLMLFSRKDGSHTRLEGFVFSTTGQFKKFSFDRTEKVLLPKGW